MFHPITTVHCFGWQIFFRAVFPWHRTTFLSLLQEADVFGTAGPKLPAILERCIALELRAKRIYTIFARAFAKEPVKTGPVSRFFHKLAKQEQEHADLLEVCRAAAIRGGWKASYFNPWQDRIPQLEEQMEEAEVSVSSLDSVDAALQLVIQIESSEVNQVFQAILAATDSPFVGKLKAFRKAMETHLTYICRRVPVLAPSLTLACRELRVRFSGGK